MMQLDRRALKLTLLFVSSCTIQQYYPAAAAQPAYKPAPSDPPPVVASTPRPNEVATTARPNEVETTPKASPAPNVVVESPPALPTQTSHALPRTAHGQILYTDLTLEGSTIVITGPLRALDPDAPMNVVTLQSLSSRDYLLGGNLVSGYDTTARQFWTLDLRTGRTLATIVSSHPVDGLTSDDRIVSRCAGGLDDDFELCTYDATGGNRTVVAREPGIYDEAAFVVGAGGTRILGYYASRTKPPWVFDLASGTRRDLPGLFQPTNQMASRPVIAASGALANHCLIDETKGSLMVSWLDGSRPDRVYDLGGLTRCECKFSPDERMIACALLPNGKQWSNKPDHLVTVDLATGRSKTLSTTMRLGEFQWSPDSREIAYAYGHTENAPWVLGIISAMGGATRDLGPWTVTQDLVGWM